MKSGAQSSDGKFERPNQVVSVRKIPVVGTPDLERSSTAYVERQNLTMRMHCRRLARACNGFSKKVEYFRAALALHFMYYNFVLIHGTLKITPAMAAGIEKSPWTLEELVERTT